MPHAFTCPNCNAPLNDDGFSLTVRCEYCLTPVIVPAEMRPASPPAAPRLSPGEVEATWAEIRQLARTHKKMAAIARLHATFDVTLGAAKDAVDMLAHGHDLSVTSFPLRSTRRPPLDAHTREHISSLLEAGEKIEAIKVYRQAMDVSLKEAVEAVEAMQTGMYGEGRQT